VSFTEAARLAVGSYYDSPATTTAQPLAAVLSVRFGGTRHANQSALHWATRTPKMYMTFQSMCRPAPKSSEYQQMQRGVITHLILKMPYHSVIVSFLGHSTQDTNVSWSNSSLLGQLRDIPVDGEYLLDNVDSRIAQDLGRHPLHIAPAVVTGFTTRGDMYHR
jgi:hypothetical protein